MVSRGKRRAIRLFLAFSALFALILLGRVLYLLLIEPQLQRQQYQNPVVSSHVVRGSIVDRNGNLLAIEVIAYDCALFLQEMANQAQEAAILAPILGFSTPEIIERISGYTTYMVLKRDLNDSQRKAIEELIHRGELPGVKIERRYRRSYPQHYHAAQLLGFTNTDNRGMEGLELKYDSLLSPLPQLGSTEIQGATLRLTLDLDIQYLLDEQAVKIDRQHHPDYLMALVLDATNGEILAGTTFPWFDPNHYNLSTAEERQNRLVSYMFEPGSAFKIYSLAAVLEAGNADLSTAFYCRGSYTFTPAKGAPITITCVEPHGLITPAMMIKKSCNGAIAHWALQSDSERFYQILTDFHFGSAWRGDIGGEISGRLATPASWSERTKPTLAFGQEIGVTALQMAAAATALANQGFLYQPHLVLDIRDPYGNLMEQSPAKEVPHSIISAQNAQAILAYMEEATQPGGTASKSFVEGIRVASKTGTAQILDPATQSYSQGNFLASTITLVPADEPQYIIYIAAANPKGSTIWGSNIAAPAIKELIEGLIRQGKLFSTTSQRIVIQ